MSVLPCPVRIVWHDGPRLKALYRELRAADFNLGHPGKGQSVWMTLGGTVAIIAVLGIIPYISLQLKAISMSYLIVTQYPLIVMPRYFVDIPVSHDTAFYVALILAVFTRLLQLVGAHRVGDACGAVSAAPVPDHGGRKRQRGPSGQGDLALSALPARHQPVRAPDCLRRQPALPRGGGGGGRRHVRPDPAHGDASGIPDPSGLHRRHVRGHRHGDRGNHRPVHHDQQRSAHARAPAPVARPLRAPEGLERPGTQHPPRQHPTGGAAGLCLLSLRRGSISRWFPSV